MTTKNISDLLSADEARSLLDYDPSTGVLMWRWRDNVRPCVNTQFAGKVAGTINNYGYRVITMGVVKHYAHRIAWLIVNGVWPSDFIDHINGVKSDNRIDNLRIVTITENARNQKMRVTNKSGHIGVYWYKKKGMWCAAINADGRQKSVGMFHNLSDAVASRKAAEITHGYHSNHGRAAS